MEMQPTMLQRTGALARRTALAFGLCFVRLCSRMAIGWLMVGDCTGRTGALLGFSAGKILTQRLGLAVKPRGGFSRG
jgi:hypothetical protein